MQLLVIIDCLMITACPEVFFTPLLLQQFTKNYNVWFIFLKTVKNVETLLMFGNLSEL